MASVTSIRKAGRGRTRPESVVEAAFEASVAATFRRETFENSTVFFFAIKFRQWPAASGVNDFT